MKELKEDVKAFICNYLKSNEWSDDEESYMEAIRYEGKNVYAEKVGSHRWYDDVFTVVELDGKFIGFFDYYMTGDACASDMGLEFDWSSVSFCEAEEVTVTKYKRVG